MSCNHLPNVTCDWCQHLHVSRPGIYVANTDGTSPGTTMRPARMDNTVPCGTPMSLNQAAWSAGWAEGYQAGMQFVNNASESEVERLRNERDELRACLLWYVENDDTNDTEHNAPWLKGKRRAMRALHLRSEDE